MRAFYLACAGLLRSGFAHAHRTATAIGQIADRAAFLFGPDICLPPINRPDDHSRNCSEKARENSDIRQTMSKHLWENMFLKVTPFLEKVALLVDATSLPASLYEAADRFAASAAPFFANSVARTSGTEERSFLYRTVQGFLCKSGPQTWTALSDA